jgi:hypothetical protein
LGARNLLFCGFGDNTFLLSPFGNLRVIVGMTNHGRLSSEGVIPKARVFSSGPRDLACGASQAAGNADNPGVAS